MLTRVYISLLTFLFLFVFVFVFGTWGISSAIAQKYTTSSSTSTTSSSSNAKSEKCTVEDLKVVKKFDSKANRKLKEARDMRAANKEKLGGDAEKNAKEMMKVIGFFSSDEYNQMKSVYKRCGIKIPTYYDESSFWVPDEMGGNGGTCTTCAKK